MVSKKEKILQAARELFVEKGFTGTSISEIVSKSEVTHSLVFHHFKSKENLWQIVKNLIVDEGKEIVNNFPSLNQPLASFLNELIYFAIDFYGKNPDVVRMLTWQRLSDNKENNKGIADLDRWLSATEHFKKTGEISKDCPSEFIITLTLSVVTSLALDPNSLLDTADTKEKYIQFVVNSLTSLYADKEKNLKAVS